MFDNVNWLASVAEGGINKGNYPYINSYIYIKYNNTHIHMFDNMYIDNVCDN